MHRLNDLSERGRWLYEAVVESVFIAAGDEDYVASRVLWENGLTRSFLWHAAQSVEKYTKAACLMNNLDAKFGHHFSEGICNLAAAIPELVPDSIEKPENYIHQDSGEFCENFQDFAKRLEQLGQTKSRYLETDFHVSTSDLVKFDILCKTIRRMTVDLNEIHNNQPARKWLADDPNQLSRPFFIEPIHSDTKNLLEKGNFGFTDTPKQQPMNYHEGLSGMVRTRVIDNDVKQTAKILASRTNWTEGYFLKNVIRD